jgi:glycosyl hydrolase family 9
METFPDALAFQAFRSGPYCVDSREAITMNHSRDIALPTLLLLVLLPCPSVESKPIFTFEPGFNIIEIDAEGCTLVWAKGAGRFSGSALKISPKQATEACKLILFEKPRILPAPDLVRVEAWTKADGSQCSIDLVFFDPGDNHEIGRHRVTFPDQPAFHIPTDPRFGWRFGACDVPLLAVAAPLRYNIEVVVQGGNVLLDGLRVVGSDSLLANGDFRDLERIPSGDLSTGTPRGWRRKYGGPPPVEEADGDFGVDGDALVVHKSAGNFVLSAPVIPVPEKTASLVARIRIEQPADAYPQLVIHQFGRQGLLTASVSNKTAKSTEMFGIHPQADRLLFLLRFPIPAGEYRVQSVDLLSPTAGRDGIKVLVDQVGYNVGEPLRFIVASRFFPKAGLGQFSLDDQVGKTFGGSLVPLGRTVGENDSDWGRYYFEGVVTDLAPGTYTVRAVLDSQESSRERIVVAPNHRLKETGELAHRFYYHQRCGGDVPGWHGPCHMDDAKLPCGTHVDLTGGYHSAGDFHKHLGDNAPISVYGMISTYENHQEFFAGIDRNANGRADLLDEAIWGAEWLLKMVDPKTGHLWTNITNDIDYYGIPECDTDGIIGTCDDRVIDARDPGDLGAFTISSWAVLARQLNNRRYMNAAEKLWRVYEEQILAGHNPRHIIAALELFLTTRDKKYHRAADRLAAKVLELQDPQGWYARSPGGPPELRIVDEGTTPAALAIYAVERPDSPDIRQIKASLKKYFDWSFRLADNPFGVVRSYAGGAPFFFKRRDDWFGGANSQYCSVAWAAYRAAEAFAEKPIYSQRLRDHATHQIRWILGLNPLDLCMFEGKGNSKIIHYHHLYAEIPGHPRGAVPGAIPNGIIREPGNSDRPWFDLRSQVGSLPGPESAEPWLPHNGYYLLMLSASQ